MHLQYSNKTTPRNVKAIKILREIVFSQLLVLYNINNGVAIYLLRAEIYIDLLILFLFNEL